MAKAHECLSFERQLLACLGIKTASMTEGHKTIMKPEIPIMSWVMLKKHSNEKGSTQKSSIIKWKWFIQEHAA